MELSSAESAAGAEESGTPRLLAHQIAVHPNRHRVFSVSVRLDDFA